MNRRGMLGLGAAAVALPGMAFTERLRDRRLFDVQAYGARGDGKAKNTDTIQKAIDAAYKAGGGVVYLGPGAYLSGGIVLKDNVTLYLEAGATLLSSRNIQDFEPHFGANPRVTDNIRHLIFARDAVNVAVCGAGKIDGQGPLFWKRTKPTPRAEDLWKETINAEWEALDGGTRLDVRPSPLLEFVNCRNLRIEGITVENPPGWTLRPINCESVFIHGFRVRGSVHGPNTDGMDITSCRNVFISNCDIATGDDALCLKSENPYGGEVAPTKNITITNCVLTGSSNGFKMGTASQGAFENITFTNSVVYNDDVPLNARLISGVAIEMVDGGNIEGVLVSNIRMQNVRTPIFVRLGNRSGNPPSGPKPGSLRGVMIDNVHATGAILTSLVTGLPGHDVEDVTLTNIRIDTWEGGEREWMTREIPELPADYPEARMFGRLPAYGLYCRHIHGIRLENVCVESRKRDMRPLLVCEDVKNLTVSGLAGSPPASSEPFLLFRNVRRAFIHGCASPPHTETFLRAEGTLSSDISLIGNDLSAAAKATQRLNGTPDDAISETANKMPSE